MCPAASTSDAADPGVSTAQVDIPYAGGTVRAQPRWPTLGADLPVAVVLHGAWDVAGTPVEASSLRPDVSEGVVAVHMDFPGNAGTSGANDHRGEGSRSAVEAVLQWAAGTLADSDGCTLAGRANADPDDLYVIGTSNGGNLAFAVLADPDLALPDIDGLVVWETPAGPQFSNVELGISPTVYTERSCNWAADTGITCAIPEASLYAGDDELCFDLSGDALCGIGDVPIYGTQDDGITYVSPPLAAAADARGVALPGWSTASEAEAWWAWRDAGRLASALVATRPALPVLLIASEDDHVQSLSDHPHVFGLGEGLQSAGARWTRLNPGPEWLPENTNSNEPNATLSLAAPTASLLTEDAERPTGAALAAAVRELSQRSANSDW